MLNKNLEINFVLSQKEKDINVEIKLNVVLYELVKCIFGLKISKILDFLCFLVINFVGLLGSGMGKDLNIEIIFIVGGFIFKEILEIILVFLLFFVNSIIVMKLQNDFVIKEELYFSKFVFNFQFYMCIFF